MSTTVKGSAYPGRIWRRPKRKKVRRQSVSSPMYRVLTCSATACTAYTRYVLEIGQSQDYIGLQVALAPCILGYGAVAEQLHRSPRSKKENNLYWAWIENYRADDFVTAVRTASGKQQQSTREPARHGLALTDLPT